MHDPYTTRVSPTCSDLAVAVRDEQKRRWAAGDRVLAEELVRDHPSLATDVLAVVDVIHGEFLLREGLGEQPMEEEYLCRFPAYAELLKDQFALDLAQETFGGRSCESTDVARSGSRLSANSAELPESFGRYRIIARLGRGGMGTVYVAHDAQLDRRVALKVPHFNDDNEGVAAARFRREAKIAATLSHPNLCPIFDVGQHGGVVFLTMPLLKGETLASRLAREGALDEKEAVRITTVIARAMCDAHSSGVIHRDLKPANVMIDHRGEPIVMDFGLARSELAEDASSTPWGVVLGTPTYMAPEQIVGDPDEISPLCDVYALGVILYQMLAGRPPYVGSVREVWQQAQAGSPLPPSTFRPGLSRVIENVCLTAMKREPKDRYPSMAAFVEALTTGDVSPVEKRALARKRPYALIAVVATAVLGVLGLGTLAWTLLRPRTDPAAGLVAGSRWEGTFVFRPPIVDYSGDVSLKVTRREGVKFTGLYATEGDTYIWECQGEVEVDRVSWRFTRVLREKNPTNVVQHARVHGRITGDVMPNLVFEHPGEGTADMTMTRKR